MTQEPVLGPAVTGCKRCQKCPPCNSAAAGQHIHQNPCAQQMPRTCCPHMCLLCNELPSIHATQLPQNILAPTTAHMHEVPQITYTPSAPTKRRSPPLVSPPSRRRPPGELPHAPTRSPCTPDARLCQRPRPVTLPASQPPADLLPCPRPHAPPRRALRVEERHESLIPRLAAQPAGGVAVPSQPPAQAR